MNQKGHKNIANNFQKKPTQKDLASLKYDF